MIRTISILLVSIIFLHDGTMCPMIPPQPSQDHVLGAILAGAIGDSLGGFTEYNFTMSEDIQKLRMSHTGTLLRSYPDLSLVEKNTKDLATRFTNEEILPYTDDTAMAMLVMEVLIEARSKNLSDAQIMESLATKFIEDSQKPDGWAIDVRSPGGACKTAIKKLKTQDRNKPYWWRVGDIDAGGNGSVMRVYPFGLVFADNLERAEQLAVEHSRLTHQHPMALAACAAMTVGTALAAQGQTPDEIVPHMERVARKYDPLTADHIRDAHALARTRQVTLNRLGNVYDALANEQFRQSHNHTFPQETETNTQFSGWTARSAVAAAVYLFTLSPDDPNAAICLGVHTWGDSDSIASMAGTLVGARCGASRLNQENVIRLENTARLSNYAQALAPRPALTSFTHQSLRLLLSTHKWPLLLCLTACICGIYIRHTRSDMDEDDADAMDHEAEPSIMQTDSPKQALTT
jgi:ADP-ribosylglycohydrolase